MFLAFFSSPKLFSVHSAPHQATIIVNERRVHLRNELCEQKRQIRTKRSETKQQNIIHRHINKNGHKNMPFSMEINLMAIERHQFLVTNERNPIYIGVLFFRRLHSTHRVHRLYDRSQ